MSKIAICIQARMSSSRLPGKVLKDMGGVPMLLRQVNRLNSMTKLPVIIVTSCDPSDDAIEQLCCNNSVQCFRGDLNNVVQRFYDAAKKLNLDAIIRVGGDDPLVAPSCCNKLSEMYEEDPSLDFIYASHKKGWMYGTAAELITVETLEKILDNTTDKFYLEHTIPYLFQHETQFQLKPCYIEQELVRESYHVSIDYLQDFDLVTRVFEHFDQVNNKDFTHVDLCRFLDARPDIVKINDGLEHGFDR